MSWFAKSCSGEKAVPETLIAYEVTAKDPVKRPARAAPVIIALDGNIFWFSFRLEILR